MKAWPKSEACLRQSLLWLTQGYVSRILGIEVKRHKKAGTIELNQGNYTHSVLKKFQHERLQPGTHARNREGAHISTGRQRTSGRKKRPSSCQAMV